MNHVPVVIQAVIDRFTEELRGADLIAALAQLEAQARETRERLQAEIEAK